MSTAWLYLLPALFIQEAVTLAATLVQALRSGTSPVVINLIWAAATSFDIMAGFWLGRATRRRLHSWRVVQSVERAVARLDRRIGERGLRLVLVSSGFVMYPYVNAFLFSWLDAPFSEVFTLIFLGDALYWAFIWGAVTGISFLSGKSLVAMYLIVIVFAILTIGGSRFFRAKHRQPRDSD